MSKRLGPVSYKMTDDDPFLGREIHQNRHFSEHTMETIDDEVAKILQEAADSAYKLLEKRRSDLQIITDQLIANEELDRQEIAALIGPSVHGNDQRRLTEPRKKEEVPSQNGAPVSDNSAESPKSKEATS